MTLGRVIGVNSVSLVTRLGYSLGIAVIWHSSIPSSFIFGAGIFCLIDFHCSSSSINLIVVTSFPPHILSPQAALLCVISTTDHDCWVSAEHGISSRGLLAASNTLLCHTTDAHKAQQFQWQRTKSIGLYALTLKFVSHTYTHTNSIDLIQ